ncbi:nuclease S1 precursor [Xylaria bambusicola]|uniref:nuclease S1 precursor n=1 Tax=Xylaria bambusicola TaxID=326684 RepID=UPI0020081157|nr:nuclease S1 precursor [Xylaria bambusicola]KAI0516876.1 nuclease S1 precursor [Xylaria bambusicola]
MAYKAAILALLALPSVSAWGAMGHEAIAYVASNFVSANTKAYFQSLLGDTSADYLATVSTWADSYRYTTAGRFSAPYHYIDANDSPPSSCNLDYSRDCGSEGCVVSALTNYTTILLDGRYSQANHQIAAKMIIHFVGDIGQPLHCEALDVGGNDIDVLYDGEDTNLHAIWDSDIPESISGGSSLASAKSWANTLTTAINSGEYKSQAAGWLTGLSVSTAATRQATAMQWAAEANAYVCSTVLKGGLSAVENKELSGAYTTTADPVVKLQVAKQGYRLAKYLDAIVAAI